METIPELQIKNRTNKGAVRQNGTLDTYNKISVAIAETE
jgi:hypothetical protein